MHEQIRIKVNAEVDKRIAPLVLALNEFPKVVTFESCENPQESGWLPYVIFTTTDLVNHEQAKFQQWLSREIVQEDSDLHVTLSLEWFAGGNPSCWLRIPIDQIDRLAEVILLIVAKKGNISDAP